MRNGQQFKAQPEWQVIARAIIESRDSHLHGCVDARTFDEKEFHRGWLEAIAWISILPEEVLGSDPIAMMGEEDARI